MKGIEKKLHKFFGIELALVFLTIVIVGLVLHFGLLQELEYKVYDFLLKVRPHVEQSDDIVIIAIDDNSVADVGTFPWPRDKYADALFRLRELGADTAVFDIEFVSPSNKGINPGGERALPSEFEKTKKSVVDGIYEVSAAVADGRLPVDSLLENTDYLITDWVYPEFKLLETVIKTKLIRDNDDYFAKGIHFFGNTWLTVNCVNIGIKVDKELREFVVENYMWPASKVLVEKDLIKKENNRSIAQQGNVPYLTPAMLPFVKQAAGVGFTNVVVDADGSRRRIELLYEYDGKFVPQLAFAPILRKIDAQSIRREKKSLIIENALMPHKDERTDVSIPLDKNGSMLINWIPESFNDSFKNESYMRLLDLDAKELEIIEVLSNIASFKIGDSKGRYLPYYSLVNNMLDNYNNTVELRDLLVDDMDNLSRSDSRYDDYFMIRNSFFDDLRYFLGAPKADVFVDAELAYKGDAENYRAYTSSKLDELFSCVYEDQIINRLKEAIVDDRTTPEQAQKYWEFSNLVEKQFYNLKQSYWDYISNFTQLKEACDGSFCIIGQTSTSSTDLGTTPFWSRYANVGTHANIANCILTESFITPFSNSFGFVLASVILLFFSLFTSGKKASIQNILGLSIVFSVPAIAIGAMRFYYYLPVVPPFLVVIIGYLSVMLFRFVTAEKDKTFLRDAFSTYLSDSVVNEIVNNPAKLTLGGDEKYISAMFTDIKSFSTFSEQVTATQLVSFLNKYLTLFSDIVLEQEGTIDKYEGDAIIAFFGAPFEFEDHAWRACYAAVRMKEAEDIFNKKMLATGEIPTEIKTRIGINTGNMVVGNMGTDKKMNYTMMGNAVNLAARLEGVNKIYHSWILVSEETWESANSGEHEGELLARRLDKVRVVGIQKPVQLYNIVGLKKELPQERIDSVNYFHKGIDLYLEKDFDGAKMWFDKANDIYPSDEPSRVFSERCATLKEKGVPDTWNGVVNMTSK